MHQNEAHYGARMAAGSGARRRTPIVAGVTALGRAGRRLSRDLSRGGLAGFVGMASRGLGLALRYRAHRRWLAVIGGQTTRKLLTLYPRIAYRHSTTYLFHDATWQQRLAMLTAHYAFLNETHGPAFFEAVLEPGGIAVWRHEADGHVLSIGLHGPCLASRHREGELTLAFAMDGVLLYQVAFSVVCDATATLSLGRAAGGPDSVLFIGQVQGRSGHLDELREAARLCRAIAPRDLLMSALSGVAQAWGMSRVVGVTDARRMSRPGPSDEVHGFAYDPFWAQYHAEIVGAGHAVMTLPFHEGPLGGNSPAHRRRARIKRQFKAGVSEDVAAVVLAHRHPELAGPRFDIPPQRGAAVTASA